MFTMYMVNKGKAIMSLPTQSAEFHGSGHGQQAPPIPRPQVFENYAFMGDTPVHGVELLPRLDKEDGLVIGPDGKLHLNGVPAVDGGFDHPTGNFASQSPAVERRLRQIPVRAAAPGSFAVQAAVIPPRGNNYQSQAAGRHRA
jgi:hypothetical protein